MINDIIDIYNEYRKKNQDKDVKKFIKDKKQVEDCLEKRKDKESSLTATKSQRHSNFQEKQLKAQQNTKKLEEELSQCETDYQAITTKMQRD